MLEWVTRRNHASTTPAVWNQISYHIWLVRYHQPWSRTLWSGSSAPTPRITVNFYAYSMHFWRPRNCFSLLHSLKAVTSATTITDRRMAAPSIHSASASPSFSTTVAQCRSLQGYTQAESLLWWTGTSEHHTHTHTPWVQCHTPLAKPAGKNCFVLFCSRLWLTKI